MPYQSENKYCNATRRKYFYVGREINPSVRKKSVAMGILTVVQTRHLVSVSVLLVGSCHLILRRARQTLWEAVQEKYWPNKVTSGASISLEKANQPSLVCIHCITVTFFHSSVQQLTEIGLQSSRALFSLPQSCGNCQMDLFYACIIFLSM